MSEIRSFDLVVGEAIKIGDTLVRLIKMRKGRSRLQIDVRPPAVEKQSAEIAIDDQTDARHNRS